MKYHKPNLPVLSLLVSYRWVSSWCLTQGVSWDPLGRYLASIGEDNQLLVSYPCLPDTHRHCSGTVFRLPRALVVVMFALVSLRRSMD